LKVQVISVEDTTDTSDAVIFGLSAFIRVTVAPDLKFVPVRDVMEISSPAVPASGTIFLNVGFPPGVVVVVVILVVVFTLGVVVVLFGVKVDKVVIALMVTDDTGLLVIFSVYVFSMTALDTFSVPDPLRYPQLPFALG